MEIKYFAGYEGTADDAMSIFYTEKVEAAEGHIDVTLKRIRGWERQADSIDLNDARWVPANLMWPVAWLLAEIFVLGRLIWGYCTGETLWLCPVAAMLFTLLVWSGDVWRRARFGSLYVIDHCYIQPESDAESDLFSTCRTLTASEYLRCWWQQYEPMRRFNQTKKEKL